MIEQSIHDIFLACDIMISCDIMNLKLEVGSVGNFRFGIILYDEHICLKNQSIRYFGATSPRAMSYGIGILMALNPLFGPIITIAFVKEYRQCLLASLRIIEPTSVQSTGATTVARKTTTVVFK
ncbi:unnamed protein product [Heligmosomoides polygyrus]|uniref:Uncharacterized protein n=1 Tax=Heligmosomoides polygyrus TaxID=6339 RepID=A0A3P7ZJU8_HELPZ|nr:unnamed protein product [Heligmosomoides polygyrus]